MIKKIVKINILIIIVVLFFLGARYLYIKNIFSKPYAVVEKAIQEALENEASSNYLITEKEWQQLLEESTFRYTRKPLYWEEFKVFVAESREPNHSLLYSNGSATYEIMKKDYKVNHRIITVQIIEYEKDYANPDSIKYISLLVENINGSWKIIGQGKAGAN